jgi:L-ribulose-5-phosphate 4-epimerase
MKTFAELKERVWKCNMDLPKHGLVLFTFGNASAIDRGLGVVAIKPSGVPYKTLTPDDIVVVDLDNRIVEGNLRPSSDTKTHLVLYRSFPEIGGITHTHATYSTAWAQARRSIPALGTTHADHLSGAVPCAAQLDPERIKRDYETETGYQIVEAMNGRSCREIEMILLPSHGPYTWGKTPEAAVYNAVVLEELAKTAFLTFMIEPQAPAIDPALAEKHFSRKHGKDKYYGQD